MCLILAFAFTNFLVVIILNFSYAIVGARLTKKLRSKMFESMLRQEMAFHDSIKNRYNVLCTQLAVHPPLCRNMTTEKLGLMLQGIAGVGFSVAIAFVLNWKLCICVSIFVPISFISSYIVTSTSKTRKVKGKSPIEEAGQLASVTVDNIKTVISLGRENYFMEKFNSAFNHGKIRNTAMLHTQAFFYSISNTLLFLSRQRHLAMDII